MPRSSPVYRLSFSLSPHLLPPPEGVLIGLTTHICVLPAGKESPVTCHALAIEDWQELPNATRKAGSWGEERRALKLSQPSPAGQVQARQQGARGRQVSLPGEAAVKIAREGERQEQEQLCRGHSWDTGSG